MCDHVESMEVRFATKDVQVEPAFIGVGCNRVVGAAAWGPSGLFAFGAHYAVAILDPEQAKILITLPGHRDLVNCVEWVPRHRYQAHQGAFAAEHFLLSGSADGDIRLWGYNPLVKSWRRALELPKAHDKAVTCICGLVLQSSQAALVASSSSDGAVRVWSMVPSQECSMVALQTLKVGARPVVAVALAPLESSEGSFVLAMGGLDNQIHLYVGTDKEEFVPACQLKGHQDWIRGLDFSSAVPEDNGYSLYLASCSQDRVIRIWKIVPRDLKQERRVTLKMYIDGPVFRAGNLFYQTSSDSVLSGHEDWVYSVRWKPPDRDVEGNISQPMCVLSASMDRTMMIWRPVSRSGIWMNEVSVGELEHTALGFYSGSWSPGGDAILAHAHGGSLHHWKNIGMQGDWQPQLVSSGHFAPVVDLSWATTEEFLLSASHDQTTRVFTCWKRSSVDSIPPSCSWHEVARPQIHGHDLNCLAVVNGKGNHRYVSGAEEKVARVFEAPGAFLDTLASVSGLSSSRGDIKRSDILVLGANMSALGLSQKPIYAQAHGRRLGEDVTDSLDTMGPLPEAVPSAITEPPLEEHLIQNTLWPESHKLYGHGNELFAMSCNYAGTLLATACKASTADFADIWLWDTGSWRAVGRLRSNSLTVTQVEFSHDDRWLLSVSRDRHLSLFRQTESAGEQDSVPYKLFFKTEAHKRIIWACAWSLCDRFFATGSRDKAVKVWGVEAGEDGEMQVKLVCSFPLFRSSVTSLAWSQTPQSKQDHVLAVGLENGQLELWKATVRTTEASTPPGRLEIRCMIRFQEHLCHVATVHRLCWRVRTAEDGKPTTFLQLASCGGDHSVRIFNIFFK